MCLVNKFKQDEIIKYTLLRIRKELCVDFARNDLSSDEILLCKAKPHLLQNEICLFTLVHGAKRLNLNMG
jgi:hypothetical protein